VAVHVTGVYLIAPASKVPAIVKFEPDGGVQDTLRIPEASEALGANVTILPGKPPAEVTLRYNIEPTRVPGHVMTGVALSVMVTLKEHEAVSPTLSVALQPTNEIPSGNIEPLVALHPAESNPE
jgi:hypothetical protein